jgi:hypothetical protein
MFKQKVLVGLLLVVAVLFAQVGIVFAAPAAQESTTTTISGNITHIETQQDADGNTVIVVTVEGYQPITLTEQEAADAGLYDMNTHQLLVQDGDAVSLTVDSSKAVPDQSEEPVNPVAAILSSFFGADASVVNQYHEDGYGFGVIAQAMWISQNVNGDASLAGLILQAKKTGNYSDIMLSDGTPLTLPDGSVPTNWGQFKKALLEKKNNLGMIVSGHAQPLDGTTDVNTLQGPGNGKGHGKGNGNGHGNGNGNGNGNSNRP